MFSLLDKTGSGKDKTVAATETPVFFADLNLDQILDRICEGWGENVRKLYEVFPATKEDEDYRREIYADIRKEDILSFLMEYYRSIRERSTYTQRKENASEPLQKQVWYLREAVTYIYSMETLHEELSSAPIRSEGMKAFAAFISECVTDDNYIKLKESALKLWQELCSFRVVLTYEKERFTIAEGKGAGEYEQFLTECFPGQKRDFLSPFTDTGAYSKLEQEIVKLFKKKHKNFFKDLDIFCKEHPGYIHDGVSIVESEIVYYLAFAVFEDNMIKKGLSMCAPKPSEDKLTATALYDLALALTNMGSGKTVVPNELYLAGDENFFVLTGPNQGGKTTYGRSLGQLIYFTKMGLDVPAEAASVPYYGNLWTHFSVEESVETGRGKLMDELVRLKPIMEDEQTGAFIVINELFTTAANYDAIEMGKRVLKFLSAKKCKGIYVTHLGELSKSCDGVVSLRATVDKDNVQTFVIERSEAKEAGGTNRQVLKYKLTYEQLKERFS